MQTSFECISCFVRQAEEAVALSTIVSAQREKILRQILHELADADWANSPPALPRSFTESSAMRPESPTRIRLSKNE